MDTREEIDLVDEMNWEDCDKIEKLDLVETGFEERNEMDNHFHNSILAYLEWFWDCDPSSDESSY